MTRALYVGSFDPFTNGHLNVLKHASEIFDEVIICVMNNPTKKRFIEITVMENIIQEIIDNPSHLPYNNIKVITAETELAYKQAQIHNCNYLVRGIRNNGLDYTYEENLADFNQQMGNINTIFIRADVNKSLSSTMIRTLLRNGENIKPFVPKEIYEYCKEHC